MWTAPYGYDAMNRLPYYQDRFGNQTRMEYDTEGRPVRISYPNGVPSPVTAAVYDIMGRLLSVDTTETSTNLLPIAYGYDRNSNCIGQSTGTDTYDYAVDNANRLIEASINRFVVRTPDRFQAGTVSQVDSSSGALSLLAYGDTFPGTTMDADHWRLTRTNQDTFGFEVRQNGGLSFAFPRGFTNLVSGATGTFDALTLPGTRWAGAEHRMQISGDFDIQVSFLDYQGGTLKLIVTDTPLELYNTSSSSNYTEMTISDSSASYVATTSMAGTVKATNSVATTDTYGKLRITRTGTTVNTYYWNNGTSAWSTAVTTYATYVNTATYVSLYCTTTSTVACGEFQNFIRNTPSATYPTSGTYTSAVYDAGRSVTWNSIQWVATTPGSTAVEFQIATSNSPSGPFTFVGPGGTSASYFTTSGTAVYAGTTGRYAMFQATLTGPGTATPTLTRVDMLFTGANPSQEQWLGYDAAGNLNSRVTETPAGSGTIVTETRTYNDLNQLTANQVVTVVTSPYSSTTVNWGYTYDASGNMKTKNDGVHLWTYNWDEDNRLLSAQQSPYGTGAIYDTSVYDTGVYGDTVTLVSYTYDIAGRMLTRTDGFGTTSFVWDGMQCVMETDPYGNVTRYYVIRGVLRSFDRTVGGVTSTYQVHADALGCVRMVTNSSGVAVANYDYDAWGNQLASTNDSIPNGGLQYRYVGAAGVRWDAATGLYYMRARWYHPGLQRFISRDVFPLQNLYAYVWNRPSILRDPSGGCPPNLSIAGQLASDPNSNWNLNPDLSNIGDYLLIHLVAKPFVDAQDTGTSWGRLAGGDSSVVASGELGQTTSSLATDIMVIQAAVSGLSNLLSNSDCPGIRGAGRVRSKGYFYDVTNSKGGVVWLATGPAEQDQFAELINGPGGGTGPWGIPTTLLSGVDVVPNEYFELEINRSPKYWNEDYKAFSQYESVNMVDFYNIKNSPADISALVNQGPGTVTIAGFCWSGRILTPYIR